MIRDLIALGMLSITALVCRGRARSRGYVRADPTAGRAGTRYPGSRPVDPRADGLVRQLEVKITKSNYQKVIQ